MCGIFGFAGFDEPGALARMGQRLRHRGPDDDGFYSAPGMHLGMRRLAVIDLAGGQQPMRDEAGRLVLVYNGEVYNFQGLMAGLAARGHRFASHSDSEVVVHAWEEAYEGARQHVRRVTHNAPALTLARQVERSRCPSQQIGGLDRGLLEVRDGEDADADIFSDRGLGTTRYRSRAGNSFSQPLGTRLIGFGCHDHEFIARQTADSVGSAA